GAPVLQFDPFWPSRLPGNHCPGSCGRTTAAARPGNQPPALVRGADGADRGQSRACHGRRQYRRDGNRVAPLGQRTGLPMVTDLEALFPGLRGTSYRITSPPDSAYNCVAWAAGDQASWWWPD